jgi:acetolactate synthase-1/2/3 large subunit
MDYQHHEEHSLFAATGDYLVSRVPGLAFVSTGPAGTNALTGLLGAWQDGLPVLVVSGQSRSNEVSYGTEVRQIGSQEAPIVDIVKRITKKSLFFMPNENLEDCVLDLLNVAVSGRPGPVWIDLPIDVQLSEGF